MLTHTPNGLDEIISTFGNLNIEDFEARYLVVFELPYPLRFAGKTVVRARCHRALVDNFRAAFLAVAAAGLEDEARDYGGIYARRNARGLAKPSTHSWGIAIDIEPARYPLGSSKRLPDGVVQAFAAAGFVYGGDFRGRKDPMHFQFASGY